VALGLRGPLVRGLVVRGLVVLGLVVQSGWGVGGPLVDASVVRGPWSGVRRQLLRLLPPAAAT